MQDFPPLVFLALVCWLFWVNWMLELESAKSGFIAKPDDLQPDLGEPGMPVSCLVIRFIASLSINENAKFKIWQNHCCPN